jgi:hypothetical protein
MVYTDGVGCNSVHCVETMNIRNYFLGFISIFTFFLISAWISPVHALVCWPQLRVNQYACVNISTGTCLVPSGRCTTDSEPCSQWNKYDSVCGGVYDEINCVFVCNSWEYETHCDVTEGIHNCSDAPSCKYISYKTTCNDGITEGTGWCTVTNQEDWPYSCWGPGDPTGTPGPTQDPAHTSTPTPVSTSTLTPTPTDFVCAPNFCDNDGACSAMLCEEYTC